MLFLSFDTDRSGKMSSYELRSALKAAGESSWENDVVCVPDRRLLMRKKTGCFHSYLSIFLLSPLRDALEQRASAAHLPEVR